VTNEHDEQWVYSQRIALILAFRELQGDHEQVVDLLEQNEGTGVPVVSCWRS
jgi:hypothetical protein